MLDGPEAKPSVRRRASSFNRSRREKRDWENIYRSASKGVWRSLKESWRDKTERKLDKYMWEADCKWNCQLLKTEAIDQRWNCVD